MTIGPYISVRTMQYTYLCDGFKVVTTTDVPCHLFKRETLTTPQRHIVPKLMRGIFMHEDVYLCFVAYKDYEQEEEGDTLIHTFEEHDWPVDQERWFYFWGKVNGETAKSTTATFRLLFAGEKAQFLNSLSNRTAYYSWGTWDITHDSPTGTILTNYDDPYWLLFAGCSLTISFHIYRSFLFFDTSTFPEGVTPVGGWISLFCTEVMHTSSIIYPHIYITRGVQSDPVVPTNYGDQLPYTTIGGQRSLLTMTAGEYNNIELNADGLSFMNLTGISKLCIRGEQDVIDWPPVLGTNWIKYYSDQKGAGFRPILTLCYPPPAPPPKFIWLEPWGDTLSQYNHWIPFGSPQEPSISLADSIITITNAGDEDCGIKHSLPVGRLPLVNSEGKPLVLRGDTIEATAESTSSQLHYELVLRKNGEFMSLYLPLALGAVFDYERWGYFNGRPYGWSYIGTGAKIINLAQIFKYFRGLLGLSTDPTDWELITLAFALGTMSPSTTDYLKNDYLGFTYG